MELWDLAKGFMQWLVLPILGSFAYFIRKYISKVEQVEIEMSQMKVKQAVLESQIDDIKQDIRDIKVGIDKLLDRIHG